MLADHQRLKQVLLNLLTNGVKYTPAGGAVIVRCSFDRETVRLAVHDTGIGIAPGMLARAFTPFDRLGAEQTGVEGTGLGLALSRRLVEAMHGKVGVESVQGEGSTFWLELTRIESPREAIAAGQVNRARDTAGEQEQGRVRSCLTRKAIGPRHPPALDKRHDTNPFSAAGDRC